MHFDEEYIIRQMLIDLFRAAAAARSLRRIVMAILLISQLALCTVELSPALIYYRARQYVQTNCVLYRFCLINCQSIPLVATGESTHFKDPIIIIMCWYFTV